MDSSCPPVDSIISADLGQPGKVVKSLVPTWNSFVFFDVNAKSFHQVTLHNGWFIVYCVVLGYSGF